MGTTKKQDSKSGPFSVNYIALKKFSIPAILLRIVAYFYFNDYLEDNFAFVSPWNSFQHVRDGIALWRHHGLYAGQFHSVPWVAMLFVPIVNRPLVTLAAFITFDLIGGLFTFAFTREFLRGKDERAQEIALITFIAYVLNPLGVGVCAVLSLSSMINMMLAIALWANRRGQPLLATILVALVAQLNVYFIVLLFAIESQPQEGKKAKQHGEQTLSSLLGRFALAALLYMANGALANIGDVFAGNVMFFLKVDDQTPNVGVFWYMFAQVFPHYRLFFLCVFQIAAFIYVVPLWRLMRKDRCALWLVYLQVISIVSSYPTYAEFCSYLPLLFAFPIYHKYFSATYLIIVALLISIATSAITLTQWLQTGSGNANFYFGACTTYILALIGLVRETVYAHLRYENAKHLNDGDESVPRYFHDVPVKTKKH